jgi:outer membrane murein-binding lipoprotein Lpp
MKNTLYAAALIAGTMLAGCQTPAQKVDAAQANVDSANSNLNNAKAALDAEYPAFKKNADEQIQDNDKKITMLRVKLAAAPASAGTDMRKQRVDSLEKENEDLKSRLYGYERERTDWVAFKVGFNHDRDKLNKAFVDFGNDLTK